MTLLSDRHAWNDTRCRAVVARGGRRRRQPLLRIAPIGTKHLWNCPTIRLLEIGRASAAGGVGLARAEAEG